MGSDVLRFKFEREWDSMDKRLIKVFLAGDVANGIKPCIEEGGLIEFLDSHKEADVIIFSSQTDLDELKGSLEIEKRYMVRIPNVWEFGKSVIPGMVYEVAATSFGEKMCALIKKISEEIQTKEKRGE